MKMKRSVAIAVIPVVHISFFAAWYLKELYDYHNPSTIIKVETVAYDPRDLLSGQYIRLRYGFNRMSNWNHSRRQVEHEPWTSGYTQECVDTQTGFLVLVGDDKGVYKPIRISCGYEALKTKADHEVFMRIIKMPPKFTQRSRGTLGFGINRFYVPEGTKEPSRRQVLHVELGLNEDGVARVRQVYLEGRPLVE